MNIGITVYPTYGGSGIVGSELGKELAAPFFVFTGDNERFDHPRVHEVAFELTRENESSTQPEVGCCR